jgi:Zn-dependent alcohol dehydrogenase
MRMLAAVMHEQGLATPYAQSRPFRIEEIEIHSPGEGEVLVEVRAAGLCHSDLSQVAGLRKRRLPVVGGHEGAGIVREVGAGVKALKPGDHVVMTAVADCGHCRFCAENRPVLCDSVSSARTQGFLPNGNRRLTSKSGEPIYHYSGISSFAQYAVTFATSLIKIDQAIPLDVAAMFGCAVVTGAGAVFNSAKVRSGQSVAIFGLGGVGLNAVMAARIAGASEIIGVDINENKFELAKELGCTHTFSARDPQLIDDVKELTRGGVDFAFEVSGSQAAVAAAYAVTRKGGEIVGVGLGATGQLYEYPHTALVSEEKVIRGSFLGGSVPVRDIPLYLEFFQEGRLPVDRLKSGTMKFDQLNNALDVLDRGEAIRQILLPHEE